MAGLRKLEVYLLSRLVPRLPKAWLYRLGDLWGRMAFRYAPVGRQVVRSMTEVLGDRFPPDAILGHAEAVFRNQAKVNLEYYLFAGMTRQRLEDLIEVEGLHHVDKALAGGKGAIVFTLHMGNMSLAQALALRGYQVNVLRGVRERRVKGSIGTQMTRRVLTGDVVPVNRLRELYRCLRRNEVVAFVLDGMVGDLDCTVSFMGRPVAFSDGVIRLAARTGAALIPLTALRRPDNRIRLLFHEPIDQAGSGLTARDTLRRCLAVFEPFLYADPGQWLKWTDYHARKRLMAGRQSVAEELRDERGRT